MTHQFTRTLKLTAVWAAMAITVVVAGDARPAAQHVPYFSSYRRPLSPIFPTTMAACDALAADWQKLCGEIGQEHSACLANTKSDGPNPGGTCSKAACQPLHGSCGEFGAEGTRAVDKCRAEVRARGPENDTSSIPAPRPPKESTRNERAPSVPAARPGEDQRQARQHQRSQRPEIGGELGRRDTGRAQVPAPEPAGALETTQAVVEAAIDDVIRKLDDDIAVAEQRVTGRRSREYLRDARDTRAVLSGIKHMIATAEYSYLVGQLLSANDSKSRTRAGAQIGLQVFTDIAGTGLNAAAEKLFSKRIAAVLIGPAAWVAVETLTPTPSNRDFSEIIRDRSTSVEQKQLALFRLWQAYDNFGSNWHTGQKRELLEATDIVSRLK